MYLAQSGYRRRASLPVESSLVSEFIKEESLSNGLSGISLCSSRTRTHRNSGTFGRHSRKNSEDKEISPKHRRSGVMGQRDSFTEDGDIVLDPSSILDEIMGKAFPLGDSDDEKSPTGGRGSRLNGTASPSQPLSSRGRENRGGVKGREARDEEQPAGERRGAQSRSNAFLDRGQEDTSPSPSSSRVRSTAMDATSSPQIKTKAKTVSQRAVPEDDLKDVPALMKTRSIERKQELRRSGSITKEDHRKSGGHWGQIRGGVKALGMFYHNRRSQFIDDSLEELSPTERSPSAEQNNPISPLATTAAVELTVGSKPAGTPENELEVCQLCSTCACAGHLVCVSVAMTQTMAHCLKM